MVPKYKAMMEALGSARLVHLYELPLMGAVEQSGSSLVASDSIRIGTAVREAFEQFVDAELYGADQFFHVNRDYDLATKHLKKHVAQYRNPARLKPLDDVLLQGTLGGVIAPLNAMFFPLFMPVGVAVYRRDGDEIEQRKQNSFPALPAQSGGAVGCYIYQLAVIGREPTKKTLGLAHAVIERAVKVSCNDNASMMALGRFVEYEGFSSSRSKLFGEMFSTWCIDYPDTTIMFSNSEMGILTEISQEGIVSPYGNEPHAVAVACGRSTDMFFDVDRHVYFNNRLQPIINHFRKTSSFNPKIFDTYYEYLPVEGSGSADRHFRNVVVKDISDPRDFVRSLPFEKCRNVNVSMLDCLDWDAPIIFMGFDENGVQRLNATYYPFYASYEPEFFDKMAPLYNEIVKLISGYMFKFENEVMSASYNGITCSLDPSWTEEEMAVGHFNMNMADVDEAGYLPRYDVWIRLVPSDALVIDENIAKRVRQAINHGELHLKLALNAKNNPAIAKALDEAHNKDVYSHITDINEVKLAPSIPDGLQEYHEEGCIWFKARTVNTIFTPFGKKVDISLPKQSPELGNIHIVQLIKGFSQ